MKRIIAIILSMLFVLSVFAACSGDKPEVTGTEAQSEQTDSGSESDTEKDPETPVNRTVKNGH